jgi:hypothetical protein
MNLLKFIIGTSWVAVRNMMVTMTLNPQEICLHMPHGILKCRFDHVEQENSTKIIFKDYSIEHTHKLFPDPRLLSLQFLLKGNITIECTKINSTAMVVKVDE